KTAVTVDVALDDGGCAVGRAVIDNDAFPVVEGLREHTLERRGQEMLAIADRHDDADFDHGVQRASVALPTRSASHASWASRSSGRRTARSLAEASAMAPASSTARRPSSPGATSSS